MTIVTFAPAVRKGSHVIIGMYGDSGSGKTYSAILLGRGLVGPKGKLALLDTETGRGLIYAKVAGGYDYAELTPPFTPERYAESVKAAEAAGVEALIIDSGSHEWEGLGGILETAEASGKQGLVKWAQPKARHKRFVQALLSTRMHLILCLRAKEKLVQGKNPNTGKEEIVSQGYVSVQDKRFIYETTVQLFMRGTNGNRGTYVVEKCPEDLLGAFPANAKVSVDTGRAIADWVSGGAPIDHAFEALKREAAEAAAGGREAFGKWWNSPAVKPKRAQLREQLSNLQSIAAEADAERERAHTQFTPAAEQQDDGLDDPFGSQPAATPPEEWRPIVGYPDYEVSDQGRVRRLTAADSRPAGYVLTGTLTEEGYIRVGLRLDGETCSERVHRLVALAFLGDPPTPQHEVAHSDGIPSHNTPGNLRWATRTENMQDKHLHGTATPRGELARDAKLTEQDVIAMRREYAEGGTSYAKLGAKYGVSDVVARKAVVGTNWAHVTDDGEVREPAADPPATDWPALYQQLLEGARPCVKKLEMDDYETANSLDIAALRRGDPKLADKLAGEMKAIVEKKAAA